MPIHTVNGNTVAQINETLRLMFAIEAEAATVEAESSQIYSGNPDDEWDALEEARLAVEAIVIPKGQPVELLPRSAHVRQIQQEFVDHDHLKSTSVGTEPAQRLRIYPA